MIVCTDKVKRIVKENEIDIIDLVIILDEQCNAECKLCVAKQVIKNETCKDSCFGYKSTCKRCCDRTDTDEQFFQKVDDILYVINGNNVKITITGGEPTTSSRLKQMLEILDKYTFGEICIETNGVGLLDEKVKQELISRNIEILLSRYSVNDEDNAHEFGTENAITNSQVSEILQAYRNIIINCIPLKCCTNTGQRVIEFFVFYKNLGAKNVVFSEAMFDTTLSAQNKEIAEYYNENVVTIEQLSKEITALGYEKILDSGEDFKLIVHNFYGQSIVLTYADMKVIAREQQNNNYYSKYLIYPSGEMGVHSIENR